MKFETFNDFEDFLSEAFDIEIGKIDIWCEMGSSCDMYIHLSFNNIAFMLVLDIDDLAYEAGCSNKEYCDMVNKSAVYKISLLVEYFDRFVYERKNCSRKNKFIDCLDIKKDNNTIGSL